MCQKHECTLYKAKIQILPVRFQMRFTNYIPHHTLHPPLPASLPSSDRMGNCSNVSGSKLALIQLKTFADHRILKGAVAEAELEPKSLN